MRIQGGLNPASLRIVLCIAQLLFRLFSGFLLAIDDGLQIFDSLPSSYVVSAFGWVGCPSGTTVVRGIDCGIGRICDGLLARTIAGLSTLARKMTRFHVVVSDDDFALS